MRTLKKTLSLVLVVAMVLGLCVVGASAYNKVEDFTDDVSKIGDAYYEAVGVLTGIGVIDGMTETAFEPQGNYTREQAAKIIAYMQLGKDKADSLKCTVAPFEDVAASRWSAGYIAYCVEQGIIDGMTETTFEPTAKLTGFQWAKMLLCAVGFGVNGEFTGSSWSVNTAKVAHTVDLFAGDLAGADHVALTREQAALYAFNVLTNVAKVAYSPNVTDYVFGIRGYWTVNGIGSTLGKDVFGLHNSVGIVVANEGTGANATYLSKDYSNTTASRVDVIAAGTGLDMMYHAARIWYVGTNTGVFTYDLAKTTPYECTAISTGTTAAAKVGATAKTLGNGAKAYEYALIDNTAYAKNSYAGVTYMYDLGIMGVTSALKNTTDLYSSNNTFVATIKAANIWTDISKISKGASVVYINAGGVYYIYSTSATTGTVKGISNKTGAVTLNDGTVLEMSAFATKAAEVNLGQTYTFLLDSHGHYIGLTKQGVANLYYYTGVYKPTSEFNGYVNERTYSAQFINVTTGEAVDLPVLLSFITSNFADKGDYFDVDVADANGIYHPVEKTSADNIYVNTYAITGSQKFAASTFYVDAANAERVYLDKDAKFIVVTGRGSYVEKTEYSSLSEMLAAYPGNTVTFNNTALTVYKTATGNMACNVVFGYLGIYTAEGSGLFLPETIDGSYWKAELVNGTVVYSYDGFYLNGAPVTVYTASRQSTMYAGFYTFEITNGMWNVTRTSTKNYLGLASLISVSGGYMFKTESGAEVSVVAEPVIVDLRAGAAGTAAEIKTMAALATAYLEQTIKVAYTLNAAGAVDVIYVLDAGTYNNVSIKVDPSLTGWTVTPSSVVDAVAGTRLYIDVTLSKSGIDFKQGETYTVNFTIKHEDGTTASKSTTATVNADGDLVAKVDLVPQYYQSSTITITAIPCTVNVAIDPTYGAYWQSQPAMTANLGDTIKVSVEYLGSTDLVAGGWNQVEVNGKNVDVTVTTNDDGEQFVNFNYVVMGDATLTIGVLAQK